MKKFKVVGYTYEKEAEYNADSEDGARQLFTYDYGDEYDDIAVHEIYRNVYKISFKYKGETKQFEYTDWHSPTIQEAKTLVDKFANEKIDESTIVIELLRREDDKK